ncbi:MAG: hypothetical protein IJ506_00610 [Clostridia bacterium]|nr:hypothetical protein [Clostridia bacterium]
MGLNSILAIQAILPYLHWIAIGVIGVIALIGFIVGAVKGVRRIGWGAFVWAGVCALFVLLNKLLAAKIPVGSLGVFSQLTPETQALISSALIAVGVTLALLIVFGILRAIARPKKRVTENNYYQNTYGDNRRELSPLGEEYDDDYEDDYPRDEVVDKSKPCAFSRILGGLISAVNAAVVTATLVGLALLILGMTPLYGGALKDFYALAWVDFLYAFLKTYGVDFLLIGIIALYIRRGWRVGLFGGLRCILATLGRAAAVGLAFYLPFSASATGGGVLGVVGKVSAFFGGLLESPLGALGAKVCLVIGQIITGIILVVIFLLLIWLFVWIFDRLADVSAEAGALGVIDGILAVIVYIALALVVCALIGAVLYLLDYYGLVALRGGLFAENSQIVERIFDVYDAYLSGWLETLAAKLG